MEIKIVESQLEKNIFIKIHPVISKIQLSKDLVGIPCFFESFRLSYNKKCIEIPCSNRIYVNVCSICDKISLHYPKCKCKDLEAKRLVLEIKERKTYRKSIDLDKLSVYLNSIYAKKIYIYKNSLMHENEGVANLLKNSKSYDGHEYNLCTGNTTFSLDIAFLDKKYLKYIYDHLYFILSFVEVNTLRKLFFVLNLKRNDFICVSAKKDYFRRSNRKNIEFLMDMTYLQFSLKHNFFSSFSFYYFLSILENYGINIREKENTKSQSLVNALKRKTGARDRLKIMPKFYFMENGSLYDSKKIVQDLLKLNKKFVFSDEEIVTKENESMDVIQSRIEIIFIMKGMQMLVRKVSDMFKDRWELFTGISKNIKMNHVSLFNDQIKLEEFLIGRTKVHNTKTLPIETFFISNGEIIRYLYKSNTSVINDYFFTKLIKYIYRTIKLKIELYNVLPVDYRSGIIEVKDSVNISTFKTLDSFKNFILKKTEGKYDILDNFLKSFSASLIIVMLFDIGDRTLDNMMITKKGEFFHIDFEYVLGEDPKFFKPKIVIPKIISQFLVSDSLMYENFKNHIIEYFKIIRKENLCILAYSKILYKSVNQILSTEEKTQEYLIKNFYSFNFSFEKFEETFVKNLKLDVPFEELERRLLYDINSSINNYRTNLLHLMNYIGKKYRQM